MKGEKKEMPNKNVYLLAIDDTDNKETRGTGFRSRQLATVIEEMQLGSVKAISRHQLYVHEDIPFTSQNSSACLVLETEDIEKIKDFSIDFVKATSAVGSDVGLCISHIDDIPEEVMEWGRRAKKEVLKMEDAYTLAEKYNIFLKGYTGTKCGVIGSLAAIGLRKWGNDGRNIWIEGTDLRTLDGVYTKEQLLDMMNIQVIKQLDGGEINKNDRIFVGNWLRPIVQNAMNIILVEKEKNENYDWKIISKDITKQLSN